MYKTLLDIVAFMKKIKFEIEERNNDLIIKFVLFMPDGENKLINLNLEKILLDTNYLINYLLEENKSIKDNTLIIKIILNLLIILQSFFSN